MGQQIEMNIKTSSGYTTLYPNIVSNNVVDFSGTNPLLSDSTKTSFGLATSATPDDVFKFLSNYNLYYWEKTQYTQKLNGTTYQSNNSQHLGGIPLYTNLYYSSSYIKNSDNTLTLQSPKTIRFDQIGTSLSQASVLVNKYVMEDSDTSREMYRMNGSPSVVYSYGIYGSSGNTIYTLQDSFGATTFVSSSSASAYPNNEISNGYRYVALGQVFNKLPQMIRYDRGSFIGTGTIIGSVGQFVQLQLKFFPQFIFIRSSDSINEATDLDKGCVGSIILPSYVCNRTQIYTEFSTYTSGGSAGYQWVSGYGRNKYYIEGNTLYHKFDNSGVEYWYYMFG